MVLHVITPASLPSPDDGEYLAGQSGFKFDGKDYAPGEVVVGAHSLRDPELIACVGQGRLEIRRYPMDLKEAKGRVTAAKGYLTRVRKETAKALDTANKALSMLDTLGRAFGDLTDTIAANPEIMRSLEAQQEGLSAVIDEADPSLTARVNAEPEPETEPEPEPEPEPETDAHGARAHAGQTEEPDLTDAQEEEAETEEEGALRAMIEAEGETE